MGKLLLIFLLSTLVYSASIPAPIFNEEFKSSVLDAVKENSPSGFSGTILNNIIYRNSNIDDPNFSGICTYAKMETTNSGFVYNINKNLLNSQALTIMLWINRENTQGNWATLLEMTGRNDNKVLSVTTESSSLSGVKNSGLSFYLEDSKKSSIRRFIDKGSIIEINKWMHISVAYSEHTGLLSLYTNGLLYKSILLSKGDMNNFVKKLYIGRSANGNSGLYGLVDEVKIFPSALSPEQIQSTYTFERNMRDYKGNNRKCKSKVCSLKLIEQSDPISDMLGKQVFTKNTFVYNCVSELKERGSCITGESNLTYAIPEANFTNAYINTFAGGDLKEIAKIASAESFASKIMTGWKGYCVYGLEEDFSWASDPYFWSSMAMSFATAGLGDASKGASESLKVAQETAKDEVSFSMNAATAVSDTTKAAIKTALKKQLMIKMGEYALCAAQAGLDIAKIESDPDNIPCDPVDQLCTQKDMSYDDQTYTLKDVAYEEMLQTSPDYAKYVSIIERKDGQVKFLIVYPSDTENLDDAALKKSMDDAKENMKKIKYAVVAALAVGCGISVASGSGASTTKSGSDSSNDKGVSGADIGKGVSSIVANLLCGPLCGAAVQLVGALATSFKSIDTCNNKGDATEKGDRHSSTYDATKLGLCKEIRTGCLINARIGSGCQLHSKYYCCYDSVLTKVLAEQVKGQLGISWSHCTGISLNEFMHISYASCKDKSGIDALSLPYDASKEQRYNAFQHKDSCIDYTEYVSYMIRKTNGRFNKDDVEDLINTPSPGDSAGSCSQ